MDYETLDLQNDRDIIIPRALYMTNKNSFEKDITKLEKIYTSAEIIEQLKKTKELLSNEVLELVALRYSIPIFYRFSKNKN
ncbi:MAG: hypothetical protein HYR66_09820 [Sphingobacteriales bacterium]|nr:hypothetical protein [Sphingobacteriales bacterium]MBI3718386.1 hypothetical protein [Sphingobacteriales bacterium]